jgi:ABC-type xylose transport system permease subunit
MKNLKNLLPKKANEMDLMERAKAPTPPFFQKLRTIGIVVGIIGGALATAPVSLPAGIVALSGYLITAGTIITTISQITVDESK